MPTFLTSSVCDGKKPKSLARASYFYREGLLARMLAERKRVRYLEAPPQFGKTYLACSYAQMAFDFQDTMWVNAKSPCFLRDLDGGSMFEEVERIVPGGGLCVFDDVPELGRTRAAVFWKLCIGLVRDGREVIVTATSEAHPLMKHASSCLVIGPSDLKFNEGDFMTLHEFDPTSRRLREPSSEADRVPGLVGRDANAQEQFLLDCLSELDDDHAGQLFAMLSLGSGSFDELEDLCGPAMPDGDLAAKCFPYVAIDESKRVFSAGGFARLAVARAFSGHARRCAAACGYADASELACRIADRLCERGSHGDAVRLVEAHASTAAAASWLAERQEALADAACVAEPESLYQGMRHRREAEAYALVAGSALRRALLGEGDTASDALARLAREVNAPLAARIHAAAALIVLDESVSDACRRLGQVAFERVAQDPAAQSLSAETRAELEVVLRADDAAACVDALIEASEGECACAGVWAIACALRIATSEVGRERAAALARLALEALAPAFHGERLTLAGFLLARLVAERFPDTPAFNDAALVDARDDFESEIARQQAFWRRRVAARQLQSSPSQDRPRLSVPLASVQAVSIPLATVQLFGRFSVSIGEASTDDGLFTRQKPRALLALLVVNAGRDLSCDRLAEALWPESTPEKARRNFSATLSIVRRALTLPDGECPYLARMQNVIHLVAEFVQSDCMALDDLCRSLMYERLSTGEMLDALEALRNIYLGEFLPGCDETPAVVAARMDYRERLVDAALHASEALSDRGETRGALRFARQALDWDPRREDVYASLMVLQAKCGQRPGAVETWQAYLSSMREVGMDASEHMQQLYERVLLGSSVAQSL